MKDDPGSPKHVLGLKVCGLSRLHTIYRSIQHLDLCCCCFRTDVLPTNASTSEASARNVGRLRSHSCGSSTADFELLLAAPSAGSQASRQLQQLFGSTCPHGCVQENCLSDATGAGLRCAKCKNALIVDKITGYCGECWPCSWTHKLLLILLQNVDLRTTQTRCNSQYIHQKLVKFGTAGMFEGSGCLGAAV